MGDKRGRKRVQDEIRHAWNDEGGCEFLPMKEEKSSNLTELETCLICLGKSMELVIFKEQCGHFWRKIL